ncbi:LysR family transcriptional regulator [Flavobacteriaceae bacterium]|nr:LysR family transcriptional regulator [Flavobacteriaceae bacterium]
MKYTLNQLHVFHKVFETKSITKASEQLFMTQPAVSIQLKNFQQQFNTPLYEHQGRGIVITEFGRQIAKTVASFMNNIEELEVLSAAYENLLKGKLKIAAASTGKYVIPYFLTDFLSSHPGIDLALNVTNKSLVVDSLVNNEVDFAVISTLPDKLEVNEELLIENKLFLVGASNTDFITKPLIYREQGSATRTEMEAYFKNFKKSIKKIELESNEAVKQAVLADIGISILPLIGLKNELNDHQLQIIPQKKLPITTQWRIVWRKDKNLSPVAKAFLNSIQSNKGAIIEKYFNWYDAY